MELVVKEITEVKEELVVNMMVAVAVVLVKLALVVIVVPMVVMVRQVQLLDHQ
mgnify:CR=1 FL=1